MADVTIFFGDNEGRGCPFRGSARFEDAKLNHVVKFFFKDLLVYIRDMVSTVMHRLCSRFEFNMNLFMQIDPKGAIKLFFVFRKDVEKISMLIKQKMMLGKSNIMDVGLFVFSIKDARCKEE